MQRYGTVIISRVSGYMTDPFGMQREAFLDIQITIARRNTKAITGNFSLKIEKWKHFRDKKRRTAEALNSRPAVTQHEREVCPCP